jgi:hypothetical protein
MICGTYQGLFLFIAGINNGGFIRTERTRLKPQRPRRWGRVNPNFLPPRRFITMAMQLAMMPPAQRDGEFVAGFAGAKRKWWASQGRRPQTRQVWWATNRT